MLSLSKGLGAPVGSVLGGSEALMDRAHRVRKLYGGGMRQAGVIAAPALKALNNVDRLAEDHAHADRLAGGLAAIDGLEVQPPETNIFMVSTDPGSLSAEAFLEAAKTEGVLASAIDDSTIRFVTHLDVGRDDIDVAIEAIERALT
jgi:threonine aldolase